MTEKPIEQRMDAGSPAYQFGDFKLDTNRCELIRAGVEVHLRPKSFEVLRYLVVHQGVLVTKDQLFDAVWPGLAVTPDSINQCIIEIRRVLGDSERTIIRTVPRRGFVFEVPVTVETEAGEFEPGPDPPTDGAGSWAHRSFRPLMVSALLLAAAFGYLLTQHSGKPPTDETISTERIDTMAKSIVVLPFADLSPDGNQAYLADGISEELLTLLSKVSELRVISRTSAFAFKEKNSTVPEIAAQLDVTHVLEGSIRTEGNNLRVTAQLIDAQEDEHLWSETYDRKMDGIFSVQNDIATAVTNVLKVKLLSGPVSASEVDPEAYQYFLRARYVYLSAPGVDQADRIAQMQQLLTEALSIDPDFAAAWALMARTFMSGRPQDGATADPAAMEAARDAALKALDIDPQTGLAYSYLGMIEFEDGNLGAAADNYEKAIVLTPSDPVALGLSATLAMTLGRLDQAILIFEHATERDPLIPANHMNLARAYYYAGDFDLATERFNKAMSLGRSLGMVHIYLAGIHLLRGDLDAAHSEIDHESLPAPWRLAGLAGLYKMKGDTARSDEILDDLLTNYPPHISNFYAFVFRNEIDHAITWIQKSAKLIGASQMAELNLDPLLHEVHKDPRWQKALQQVGVSRDQLAGIEFDPQLPE